MYIWSDKRFVSAAKPAALALLIASSLAHGQTWSELHPAGTPPAPRADASAVYDPGSNRMIVFGGNTVGCSFAASANDTWILTEANGLGGTPQWIQLATSGPLPGGRRGHAAIYNSATNRMVVYSGDPVGCAVSRHTDVWVLTNANGLTGTPTWIQLNPTGPIPPGRSEFGAAYDQANNRMIVYGGFGPGGNMKDTWVLLNADGSTGTPQWVQLFPSNTLPYSSMSATAYDAAANRMIFAGGAYCCTYPISPFGVWALTNANGIGGTPQFVQLSTTGIAPSARYGMVGALDIPTNTLYFFGGATASAHINELWSVSHANGMAGTGQYQQIVPSGPVPPANGGVVANPASVYDQTNRRMVMFGGVGESGLTNDVWVLSLNAEGTPPVITASVNGPAGNNGWYAGPVNVTWTVSDPESPLTASTGCGPVTLTADTAGTTLTCTATSAGGTATQSVTIKIDQTAPAIAPSQAPPANAAGWNNSGVTVTFVCSDALSGLAVGGQAYTVASEGAGQAVSHTCVDQAGNAASATAMVNLDKTAPGVTNLLTSPNPQALGGAVSLTGTLADALSGLKSAQYTVDGGAPVSIAVSGASASISENLNLNAAGVYQVCVSVNDAAGNAAPAECTYTVVYDPDGGFVTGGGWFNSPAGAYMADPAATGKANFGFVSKYLKGATAPTGETQFQFKAAGLDFKSTSYEWLVIAGARAQYKGFGNVNGTTGYRFLLTAIDGEISGGGGLDRIRIKIWKDDAVVYDNLMGAEDGADPSTVLGGGSIVIHKP